MLRVFFLFFLFAIPSIQCSCVRGLLESRLNNTDIPKITGLENINMSSYNVSHLCRSHSRVNPISISSAIIAVSFSIANASTNASNSSYFILHYNSCNSSSGEFNAPIILVNVTSSVSLVTNPYPDFCYECSTSSSTMNYCLQCNSSCNTTSDLNDLQFCYGPSSNECCNYVHNSTCVTECPMRSYPDMTSTCITCNLTCGNGTLRNTSCDCMCNSGYSGTNCEKFVCDPSPCGNRGMCSAVGASNYNCTCNPGYTDTNCTTFNSCFSSPCMNGNCTALPNNYTCTCEPGYSGRNCSTFNPCSSSPCINGNCTALPDKNYTCTCDPGYSGRNCTTFDLCFSSPCMNGSCTTVSGGTDYTCTCELGYSGRNCATFDPCSSSPCVNGNCSRDSDTNYTCTCEPGYSGGNCTTFDPCYSSPCVNGNCSRDSNTNYTCMCELGYSDENCTTFDPCSSMPCLNYGNCDRVSDTNFTCSCPAGYSGELCENVDPCNPNPCVNGTCSNATSGQYMCNCSIGYEGVNCTTRVMPDPCLPNPCNNGTCSAAGSGFTCACPSDKVGSDCSTPNPCSVNPNQCSNNGVCNGTNTTPFFRCNCKEGLSGLACEDNALCNATNNTNPCKNNGNCTAVNATSFTCQCPQTWVDEVCNILPNPCNTSTPCMNNGTCARTNAMPYYRCSCVMGYTGTNCETDVPSPATPAAISTGLVAGVAIVVVLIIIVIVVILVLVIVYYFYRKSKKGKVDIVKRKTSKVHPTNGEPSTIDEEKKLL